MAEIYISVKCLFDGLGILTWYGEDDLALDGRITVASMTFAINLLLSNAAPARIKRKNAASPIPGNTSSPTDETDDKNNCCRRQALKPTMLTENQDMVPTNSPKRRIHTPFHACVDGQDLWERGSRENPDTGWLSVHAQHQFIRGLFRGPQTMSYAITSNALDLVKLLFPDFLNHQHCTMTVKSKSLCATWSVDRTGRDPNIVLETWAAHSAPRQIWQSVVGRAFSSSHQGGTGNVIQKALQLTFLFLQSYTSTAAPSRRGRCRMRARWLLRSFSGLLPPFEVDLDGFIGKQLTLTEREKLSRSESSNVM